MHILEVFSSAIEELRFPWYALNFIHFSRSYLFIYFRINIDSSYGESRE